MNITKWINLWLCQCMYEIRLKIFCAIYYVNTLYTIINTYIHTHFIVFTSDCPNWKLTLFSQLLLLCYLSNDYSNKKTLAYSTYPQRLYKLKSLVEQAISGCSELPSFRDNQLALQIIIHYNPVKNFHSKIVSYDWHASSMSIR